ncbi:MAG: radical SAM protein [Spirochaetes bacterium]|nr:radical SAM protein [Spirochaetota bacterium]
MAKLYYIQVTRECNQMCRFCSNPPNENRLTLKKGKNLIDYYIKKGCDGLVFTGGEPTLSEHLPSFIQYANKRKVYHRIITNGQRLADFDYLKSLKEAGLYHMHLSVYSVKEDVQDFLTRNPGSWKHILKALENLGQIGDITVDINIVINYYNADHLYENAKFFVETFPFVNHFVFNNLDPSTSRARSNKDTIPTLNQLELSLHDALVFLSHHKKTFRIERLPLCYLTDFEHTSTETRKIVKSEDRSTFFLDNRGFLEEKDWLKKWGYSKAPCCEICFLNSICPGLFHMDKYYSSRELYPVFVDKKTIMTRILNGKR